ncbi:MAG: flagellar hook capping FlgD N-terminal domain-containing protein [Acidimicrobiales bacterium]
MAEGVSAIAGSLVDAPEYRVPLNEEEAPSGELGKDAFLKLLVAQLKYQDPLEPSSSEDFLATTAQFTVVEKLDELTKQGENTQLVNSLTTASSLIGREVTASQGDGITITAVVNESRIVGGQVTLQTDQGPIGLDEIVSVGAAPVPLAPVVAPPAQTQTTTETSNETGSETSNQAGAEAVVPAESVDPDAEETEINALAPSVDQAEPANSATSSEPVVSSEAGANGQEANGNPGTDSGPLVPSDPNEVVDPEPETIAQPLIVDPVAPAAATDEAVLQPIVPVQTVALPEELIQNGEAEAEAAETAEIPLTAEADETAEATEAFDPFDNL